MDWASIIGIGLQFLGQKKASDAAVGSATDYNAALIEAAKPKNVVGPAGGVVWDEATQTFVIAPSNPLMGLMGANLEDFTIDQAAGAFALTAGAIGSLLLVIWQSKCHCKINLRLHIQ